MSRDEIEEELAVEFTPETLSVYADLLMAENDPRGEVIAIDLRGGEGREAAIERWLGPLARLVEVDHGFITDIEFVKPSDLTQWFEHPAAKYLRGVRLRGDSKLLWFPLKLLVKHCAPWVRQLSIHVEDHNRVPDKDAVELLGLPRLERLDVQGTRALGEIGHPFVKALRVTGGSALGSLFGTRPSLFPAVTSLDLAVTDGVEGKAFLERLPALRRLDLSRNEPGHAAPHYLGGYSDILKLLGEQPGRERLTHLRVPSVRSPEAADRLRAVIASMPKLREVEIARAYRLFPPPSLPEICTQPEERWPWPPADRVNTQIGVMLGKQVLDLDGLIRWLEDTDLEMTEPWHRLFSLLEVKVTAWVDVPARVWRAALDTLDDDPRVARWKELTDFDLKELRVRVAVT